MSEVRRLTSEDAHFVQQIVEQVKSERIVTQRIDDFLRNEMNYVIACIDDSKVVGFVLAYELPRYDKNNMMYIHEVDVQPEYWRRGIGRRLIAEITRICGERGLYKMFVITNKSNIPACGLYESTGAWVQEDDSIVYCYDKFE